MDINIDTTDLFQCGLCKQVFTDLQIFLIHKEQHKQPLNSTSDSQFLTTIDNVVEGNIIPQLDVLYTDINTELENISECNELSVLGCDNYINEQYEEQVTINIETTEITIPDEHICSICQTIFNKKSNLDQHRHYIHERNYQCQVCGRKFVQNRIKKHMIAHMVWPETMTNSPANNYDIDKNIYKCLYCSDTVKTFTALRTHMIKHRKLKRFICPILHCKELFEHEIDIIEHSKQCAFSSKYRCSVCFKFLSTQHDIDLHAIEHIMGKSSNSNKQSIQSIQLFSCSVCHVTFKTENMLANHLYKDSHRHPCPKCTKLFVSKDKVKRHLPTHQKPNYTCDVCNAKFAKAHYLTTHLLVHSLQRNFACDICRQTFKRKENLVRHISVHQSTKNFICPFVECELAYKRKDYLQKHIKSHSKVKKRKKSNLAKIGG